eukprot:gb/GECH01013094.1/.p1 GENE.gb/GECH01013094.1/~~gb/GECH01013094.1/.p1  ORF type:complete len:1376 (+),score=357.92 gb/GECH01013094.1/:1-4128(+)
MSSDDNIRSVHVDTNEIPPPCPEEQANIFSRLIFWWMGPLMKKGYRKTLDISDLFDLRKVEKSEKVSAEFQREWKKEKIKEKPSLLKTLFQAYGWRFVSVGILKLCYDLSNLSSPLLIQLILTYIEEPSQPVWRGYLYVVLLFVMKIASLLMIHQYFHVVMTTAIRVRGGLITGVYNKSLGLSNSAKQGKTTGEIVNLMSIDTQRISDLLTYLHMSWSGAVQITICLIFLFNLIGWATIAGVVVMILLIPLQGYLTRFFAKMRRRILEWTDERIKIINEVLQGIRVIKFYAWEKSFLERVSGIRNKELSQLRQSAALRSVYGSIMQTSPVIVSVITFMVYALEGNDLKPSIIFPALAYFDLLRFPMTFFPMVISFMVDAKVSLNRILSFLKAEEIIPQERGDDFDVPIRVENGSFTWGAIGGNSPNEQDAGSSKKESKNDNQHEKYKKLEEEDDDDDIDEIEMSDNNQNTTEEITIDTNSPETENKPINESRATANLKNIDLKVEKAQLCCIVGSVGSGKSSLLNAIIGEMSRLSGNVKVSGDVAYCPQQAWIQNATLMDNIIFGRPYDAERYATAIRVSALQSDIDLLPAGDMTEIGEKGINLSGGQRQRVNIARAVYSGADVFLFDDPLSAVDAHVGKHIFEQCINGILKGKTRILVTHQLQYLRNADQVLVLKDGQVMEQGSYIQLLQHEGEMARLVASFSHGKQDDEDSNDNEHKEDMESEGGSSADHSQEGEHEISDSKSKDQDQSKPDSQSQGALIQAEERAQGVVKLKVYSRYIQYAGGWGIGTLVLGLFVAVQACVIGTNTWLAIWSNRSIKPDPGIQVYLAVYGSFAITSALLQFARNVIFAFAGLHASTKFHSRALYKILRAPMRFFDTTPTGRILNRFSKDQEAIDNVLITVLQQFLSTFVAVIGTLIVIGYVTPLFFIALGPIMFFYYYVMQYYRRTSRELKRLDSVTRSPLYAHFSETLGGLSTIRAYHDEERFLYDNRRKLETNLRAFFGQISSQRWLGVRLEFIGTCIIFFASLLAVVSRSSDMAGLIGLSLTYALQITGTLNWTVRQFTETENQMNAVERLLYYSDELESEAPLQILDTQPTPPWPSDGNIIFEDFSMRYSKDLNPVLRYLNLNIKGCEKIGVVGRTGAGKSSMMTALFRIVEADTGRIIIDGVDISKIGLEDLRSNLAIIPQEPFLFSGQLRENLDPFDRHTEDQIWTVLQRAHLHQSLKKRFDELDPEERKNASNILEMSVAENGENFSVGQRQLICLARAMLRRVKILVMDEATASVDLETDTLIQRTVREEFKECTVLTIAHRLNTIIDSDRILVLEAGEVAEFDTPKALLSNQQSALTSMVAETGSENAAKLRSVAMGESSLYD